MKTAKKALALFLSVLMVFTMVSSSVVAVAEKTQIEDIETSVDSTFDSIRGIIDGVHNLVGGIMSMLGKECVFCDEIHGEDADTDTQEPAEPEASPSEPEEPEEPVEPEVPSEPDTEEPEEETKEDELDNVFDSVGGLFDAIHSLVGGILAIFDKECPFCDKVHGEDEGETEEPEEPDAPEVPEEPVEPETPEEPVEPEVPEETTYTVSFDLNYEGAENNIPSQSVKEGETVVEPAEPVREGYAFLGWYEESSCQNKNNFDYGVVADKTLYAGWLLVEKITLTASETEFDMSDGVSTVYFYAESTKKVSQLYLYTTEHKLIANMYDDGNYALNGDDLIGDGVFSCKLDIDRSVEATYSYYAASELLVSNELQIKVCAPLTTEELENIEKVNIEIQNNIFEVEGYNEKSLAERMKLAEDVLDSLVEEGLIISESIGYNEESATYTFLYSSYIIGSIALNDWSSEQNGVNTVSSATSMLTFEEDGNAITNTLLGDTDYIGDAIILWSFDQAWDNTSYRRPFYLSVETDWDTKGLETTVDWDTTVADYKNLSGYEVIVFSGHGAFHTYSLDGNNVTTPSLILSENATSENNIAYSTDLTEYRIAQISVQGGTKYAILPVFFSDYYGENNGLDGAFIYAENCEFRGSGSVLSDAMTISLNEASAEAVVGFHNSVMADYSRELMKTYIDSLIDGETTSEAFTTARDEHGYNDDFTDRQLYGPIATPYLTGKMDATLIPVGIKNGDFEDSETVTGWQCSGDTRVISKLSSLMPQSKSKMAIISTGIGSGESDYLAGTEGSIIQQTFRVNSNNSKISYTYNVVSEEPMEYVGSNYDDTFEVEILDNSGNLIEVITKETVNTSTWYSIEDINFEGGDNTTYHTGWKTVIFDAEDYIGEKITVRFKVYDKGDSIYDTAVLIDKVYSYAG